MTHIEKKYRQALDQIAEIKRILYATEHAWNDQKPLALLVTSAAQGEGKSLLSATLAVAAASTRKYRVALVDFNWYRPAIHRLFDLQPRLSVDQILSTDFIDLVISQDFGNLSILTAPVDYREQARSSDELAPMIRRIIGQAKECNDLVIVDGGSLFPTNRMMIDPVMLSGSIDAVVMVVMMGATARQQVRHAQKTLETAGVKILGAVSNRWRISR